MLHVFMRSWCHLRNESSAICRDTRTRALLTARTLSYVPLVKHCTTFQSIDDGKIAHASFLESGHQSDTLVMNLIVQMYSKCGALDDALATFESMEERNVFSWTIMIGAYAEHQHYKEALRLFKGMEPLGVTPNRVTFITVASACACMADLDEGKLLHSCIESSPCMSDVTVGNSLVSMYDKCGSIHDAHLVFGKMSERNTITWNSIVAAFAHHGRDAGALQLFHQMQQEDVIPDKHLKKMGEKKKYSSFISRCN